MGTEVELDQEMILPIIDDQVQVYFIVERSFSEQITADNAGVMRSSVVPLYPHIALEHPSVTMIRLEDAEEATHYRIKYSSIIHDVFEVWFDEEGDWRIKLHSALHGEVLFTDFDEWDEMTTPRWLERVEEYYWLPKTSILRAMFDCMATSTSWVMRSWRLNESVDFLPHLSWIHDHYPKEGYDDNR